MTRISTWVVIARPVEDVFEFVTTPGRWPLWHPSSLAVGGATDHSLDAGEQCTEDFRVAGRRGRVMWTVRERDAPGRWVIDGAVEGGGGGTIAYRISAVDGGARFDREFTYTMRTSVGRLLDALVVRRLIAGESMEALRRVKRLLEERDAYLPPTPAPR